MIINGDIVQKALAQLSGTGLVPVAFSFGWVVYSVQALSSMIGTGRLMPATPDLTSVVINLSSGHQRANRSWILGRLLRDWNYKPLDKRGLYITVLDAFEDIIQDSLGNDGIVSECGQGLAMEQSAHNLELGHPSRSNPLQKRFRQRFSLALTKVQTSIHRTNTWWKSQAKMKGWVWVFAWAVIAVQLIIASIPLRIHDDASTLTITVAGTCLAFGWGFLHRWREEKWCCRTNSPHAYCLLEGNGGVHVMVVFGNGVGLNFEDLAGSRVLWETRPIFWTSILTVLWLGLLIVIARKEGQTWYLMIVGGLGILQNIVVAGAARPASAFGFHLRQREVFHCPTVRDTLCKAEENIASLGVVLRPIYFPGEGTAADNAAFDAAIAKRLGRGQQAGQEAANSGTAGADEGNTASLSRRTQGGDES